MTQGEHVSALTAVAAAHAWSRTACCTGTACAPPVRVGMLSVDTVSQVRQVVVAAQLVACGGCMQQARRVAHICRAAW